MEVAIVFQTFRRVLLQYIRSKVRSNEDAEDILQNVFMKISTSLDKLNDDQKLRSWVFAITRNAVIDYYRTSSRTMHDRLNDDVADFLQDEETTDSTKGLDQCMHTMIDSLPEHYRDVIVDVEMNGMKQKDLSVKYGLAYPSMRSRVQRARTLLKQRFYDCCHIAADSRGNIMDV
jgi:RNA polymerase sigma-70 factor, ECF subfamily